MTKFTRTHMRKIKRTQRFLRIMMALPILTLFMSLLAVFGIQYNAHEAVLFGVCAFVIAEVFIKQINNAEFEA